MYADGSAGYILGFMILSEEHMDPWLHGGSLCQWPWEVTLVGKRDTQLGNILREGAEL